MICRSLEGRDHASAAPRLDQLQWETERVLEVLRIEAQRGSVSDATLPRRLDRTGRRTTKRDPTYPPGRRSLRRPA